MKSISFGKYEVGILAGVLAFLFLILAFRQYRRKSLSDSTMTSRIKSILDKMPEGIVEIKGRVVCERPLTSRLSGIECVYYNYHLRDYTAEGSVYKNRQERGFSSGASLASATSGAGEMWADFEVQDSTGKIKVLGRGAEVCARKTWDGFYRGPQGEVSELLNKTLKTERKLDRSCKSDLGEAFLTFMPRQKTGSALLATKVSEEIIPVGCQIYVLGKVTEIRGERIIMRDDAGGTFLISTLSEDELVGKISRWMWAWFMLGFLSLMVAAALLFPFLKK